MLRETLMQRAQRGDAKFRWRGGDVSRLEALSDGVFALSLTLLVVPFEVGGIDSFEQFRAILMRAPVLVLCFAFLVMVWQAHFRFHRRYGLEDGLTVWLDAAFLFVLLLCVYPLKLLATLLVNSFGGLEGLTLADLGPDRVRFLMQSYAVGFGALYGVLYALTRRAWARREVLELNLVERIQTRGELRGQLAMILTAGASLALATAGWFGASGLIYISIGPVQGLLASSWVRAVERAEGDESPESPGSGPRS